MIAVTKASVGEKEAGVPVLGPAFARHETFHPRHGWIKKGFDAALADPAVFTREDAAVVLGVGKNMVRAIRYWCLALKVLETQHGAAVPTEFGRTLLSDDGWDPFLEDPASLWLLHSALLSRPGIASAWEYAFFGYAKNEFTIDEMVGGLQEYAAHEYPESRIAESSLRKDVSCIVRMYASKHQVGKTSEDSIQCPFADLGLISDGSTPDRYAFVLGEKTSLAPAVVTATCLQFAHRNAPAARTVTFSRLLRDRGSPGLTFKLTESALYSAIEKVAESRPDLSVSDAGGVVQLGYSSPPDQIANELLREHYATLFAEVSG